MTTRKINQFLWLSAGALAACAVLAVALGVYIPLDSADVSQTKSSLNHSTSQPTPRDVSTISSSDLIFARPLRVSLNEVRTIPSVAPTSAPVVSSLPPLVLVGTVGTSLAMIKTPDGSIVVASVGEQVAGANVLAIRSTQVDLRINGRMLTLDKVADSPDSTNP